MKNKYESSLILSLHHLIWFDLQANESLDSNTESHSNLDESNSSVGQEESGHSKAGKNAISCYFFLRFLAQGKQATVFKDLRKL